MSLSNNKKAFNCGCVHRIEDRIEGQPKYNMATDRMSDLFGSSSVGAKDVEMAVSGGSSYSKLFKEFDAIKAMIVKIK